MGPKKSSQAPKKRKAGEGSSSRQEPFEGEPLIMLTPLALEVSNFGSSERLEDFLKCNTKRKVMGERVFPENILDKLHFPYTERLKAWGWFDMMTDATTEVYSNVVKSFYFNARPGNNYIESSFQGVAYRVTRDDILKALGGNVTTNNGVYSAPDNFPYLQACRQLWRDPQVNEVKKKTKGLPLGTRILHLILAQVINPRRGTYTRVDPIDIFYLSKIVNDDPFDLVEVMIRNILNGMRMSRMDTNENGLPYGKILTKIIKDKVTTNPREVREAWQMAPLDLRTIGSMGWEFDKRTNTWRTKEEIEAENQMDAQDEDFEPQADEEEEDQEEEAQDEEQDVLSEDDPFRTRFDAFEERIDNQFHAICLELDYVMETQRHTLEYLTTLGRTLNPPPPTLMRPPPIFPPMPSSNRFSPSTNPNPNPDS